MNAINQQVDGNHYANLAYQPFTLAMDLGSTPGFCKLAKYLTREKNDRMINLKKAYHVIQLEQEWIRDNKHRDYNVWVVSHELSAFEKMQLILFCNQFKNGQAYYVILSNMLLGKFGKAKENLTKFVKYQRWEIV